MRIEKARAAHNTAIIALVFLVGACVRLGHIQQTEPIRTLNFTGSAQSVSQCVQQRLSGQTAVESLGNRFVVYNSVKGEQNTLGITHYSITLTQVGAKDGVAELKVIPMKADTAQAGIPPGGRRTEGVPDATIQRLWTPVVNCAAQAKAGA